MALYSDFAMSTRDLLRHCHECGAVVVPKFWDAHLDWHEAIDLEAMLAVRYYLLTVEDELSEELGC